MSNPGSSSIQSQQSIRGITGPTGPTGPDGPIGATGPTGATGIRGNTGVIVQSGKYVSKQLVLVLSDGTEIPIEGLTGTTADYSGVVTGENLGSGFHVFQSDPGTISGVTAGLTFRFAGITGGKNVEIENDGDVIVIGVTYEIEPAQIGSTANQGLAFLSKENEVSGTSSDKLKVLDDYFSSFDFFAGSSGTSSGVILSEISTVQSVGPVYDRDSEGITLDLSKGTVFKIQTPIGINGFEGLQLNGSGSATSFTAFIDGNDFWKLPSNLRFEEGEDFFSCGVDIVNFTNVQGDGFWSVTFSSRGYDTDECSGSGSLGSCCYQETDEEGIPVFKCTDFIDERRCQSEYDGTFRPFVSCEEACDNKGDVCCSNGICLEYVSQEECDFYHGTFWSGVSCGTYPTEGTNAERFCYDPCQQPYACCRDGLCLGEYSVIQCEEFLGGIASPGECGTVDCCENIEYVGACCYPERCEDAVSSRDCNGDGVFMGHGTRCADVNCCIEYTPTGFCCKPDGTCDQETQEDCQNLGGFFGGTGAPCPLDANGNQTCIGNCCKANGDCIQSTPQECSSLGDNFGGIGAGSTPCDSLCIGRCCEQNGCVQKSKAACTNGTWKGLGDCTSAICGNDGRCCHGVDTDGNGVPDSSCTETNLEYCNYLSQTQDTLFTPGGSCSGLACFNPVGACCSYDEETGLHLCANRSYEECNALPNSCWKGGDGGPGCDPAGGVLDPDSCNFVRCEDYTGPGDNCTNNIPPFHCGICNDIDPIGPKGCCMRPVNCKVTAPGSVSLLGGPQGGGFNQGLGGLQAQYGGKDTLGGSPCPTTYLSADIVVQSVTAGNEFPSAPENPAPGSINLEEYPQTQYDLQGITIDVLNTDQYYPNSVEDLQGSYTSERMKGEVIANAPACVQMGLFECCGPPPDFPYCGLPYDKLENHPDFPQSPNAPAFFPDGTDGKCIGAGCPGVTQDTFWEWRGDRVGEGVPDLVSEYETVDTGNKYVYPDLNSVKQKYFREIFAREFYPNERRGPDGLPLEEYRGSGEGETWADLKNTLTETIIWPEDIPRDHVILGMPDSFYTGGENLAFTDNAVKWADNSLYTPETGVDLSGVWPYSGPKDNNNRSYFSPYMKYRLRQWMQTRPCVDYETGVALTQEECLDQLIESAGYGNAQELWDDIFGQGDSTPEDGDGDGGPGATAEGLMYDLPLYHRYTNSFSIGDYRYYMYTHWNWTHFGVWGGLAGLFDPDAIDRVPLYNYNYGNKITYGSNDLVDPDRPGSGNSLDDPFFSFDLRMSNLFSWHWSWWSQYYRCDSYLCQVLGFRYWNPLSPYWQTIVDDDGNEIPQGPSSLADIVDEYMSHPLELRNPAPIYNKQLLPDGTDQGGITLPALLYTDPQTGEALSYENAVINPQPGWQYYAPEENWYEASYLDIPIHTQRVSNEDGTLEDPPRGSFQKAPPIDNRWILDSQRNWYRNSAGFLRFAEELPVVTLHDIFNDRLSTTRFGAACQSSNAINDPESVGMKLWRKGDCQMGWPIRNPNTEFSQNVISREEMQARGGGSDDNIYCPDRGAMGGCEYDDKAYDWNSSIGIGGWVSWSLVARDSEGNILENTNPVCSFGHPSLSCGAVMTRSSNWNADNDSFCDAQYCTEGGPYCGCGGKCCVQIDCGCQQGGCYEFCETPFIRYCVPSSPCCAEDLGFCGRICSGEEGGGAGQCTAP